MPLHAYLRLSGQRPCPNTPFGVLVPLYNTTDVEFGTKNRSFYKHFGRVPLQQDLTQDLGRGEYFSSHSNCFYFTSYQVL